MEFSTNKPIYRQIIDYSFGRIITGDWREEERIPSVRELSVQLAVNSHTVLKAYEYLQASEIIIPRRGMGFYLAADATQRVNSLRREEFFTTTVPEIAREMELLGITPEELIDRLRPQLKS
ncbi:MAG: GntR family transcriptional regulator [Muribaculaceae bacterium]|nr:GntR family transcriptional regulator [Muribaculaceae bacterium]